MGLPRSSRRAVLNSRSGYQPANELLAAAASTGFESNMFARRMICRATAVGSMISIDLARIGGLHQRFRASETLDGRFSLPSANYYAAAIVQGCSMRGSQLTPLIK